MLARAIGVPPSFVSKMVNGEKAVPFDKCMPIELATDGAVTRRDLKPDEYLKHWPELADTTAQKIQPHQPAAQVPRAEAATDFVADNA